MFSKPSQTKFASEINKEQNRISVGTVIKEEIEAKGGFRIEGTLNGSLKTTGKALISMGGFINGNLLCLTADFEGK